MSGKQDLRMHFKRNPNRWISVLEVHEKGGMQYGTRIKELREDPDDPMIIENKIKYVNGKKHSWFRYHMPEKSGQLIFA